MNEMLIGRIWSPLRVLPAGLWLALGLGLLAVGCAKTTGSGNGPSTSTETGNPPVFNPLLVELKVSADGVSIVGEPGAVTPGGSDVEVEVVGTGETYRATAKADGSFEVVLMGGDNDVFLVRTVDAEGKTTGTPVFVYQGGAHVGGSGEEPLSCGFRDEVIETVLDAANENLDVRCEADSDCARAPGIDGCYYGPWICATPVASKQGLGRLARSVGALEASVCADYREAGCFDGKPVPRCKVRTDTAVCNAGRCEPCTGEDCLPPGDELTCDERDAVIEDAIGAVLDDLDLSCAVDSDCVIAPALGECYHRQWLCSPPVVTRAGAEQIAEAAETLSERSICDGYADAGCLRDKPQADCALPPTAMCQDNTCTYCVGEDCARPSVDDVRACAPHAVVYEGGCEPEPRYHWFGTYCAAMNGCSCTGPDCARAFTSMEACEAAHAGCAAITTECGGWAGSTCASDEYCADVPGVGCGTPDGGSVCQPRPDVCDTNYDPVCGCDGKTYGNRCDAASQGMGFIRFGECTGN